MKRWRGKGNGGIFVDTKHGDNTEIADTRHGEWSTPKEGTQQMHSESVYAKGTENLCLSNMKRVLEKLFYTQIFFRI